MTNKFIKVCLLLVISGANAQAKSAKVRTLTLQDALTMLRERQPELAKSELEIEAARVERQNFFADLTPNFKLSTGVRDQLNEDGKPRGYTEIEVREELRLSGFAQLSASDKAVLVRKAERDQAIVNFEQRLVQKYLAMEYARSATLQISEALAASKKLVSIAARQYEQGTLDYSSQQRILAQQIELEKQKLVFARRAADMENQLKELIHYNSLEELLWAPTGFNVQSCHADFSQLTAKLDSSNLPNLLAAELELDRRESLVTEGYLSSWGNLFAGAVYQRQTNAAIGDSTLPVDNYDNENVEGYIGLSWDFSFFSINRGEIRFAKINRDQAVYELSSRAHAAKLQIDQIERSVATSYALWALEKRRSEALETISEESRKLFANGIIDSYKLTEDLGEHYYAQIELLTRGEAYAADLLMMLPYLDDRSLLFKSCGIKGLTDDT